MSTVLVTGSAGRIAGYLIPELLIHGYTIRGFDVKPTALDGVESIVGDIRVFDEVRAATEGVDMVCHLAAIAWDGLPIPDMFRLNVAGTVHVFEAAERCGVGRVVHASSIRAYGLLSAKNPVRPEYLPVTEEHPTCAPDGYGMSKAATETIARCYHARGLSVIVLRPGGVIDFTQGKGTWGPLDAGVHALDAAQAFRLALETARRFGVYNVVSRHRYTRDGGIQTPVEQRAELESVGIGADRCEPGFWAGAGNVYAIDKIVRELAYRPTW